MGTPTRWVEYPEGGSYSLFENFSYSSRRVVGSSWNRDMVEWTDGSRYERSLEIMRVELIVWLMMDVLMGKEVRKTIPPIRSLRETLDGVIPVSKRDR